MYLLYRHECFTGKYTTRKVHKNQHTGPEWFIFHNLTLEFIDDFPPKFVGVLLFGK